ncbi:carbonic anhydrase [Actinomadura graeca]|uniref:Carbonic anhydrase n=1 Tax=Actinomadura graeca TaxID=2750812 RepID=A0ABX8QT92_9ACTN|nr:carbonic anhydrase [Actinomadura graeca]QXJ21945.1 carbonic anhydrase [Actinomadura graeca]
MRTFIDHARSFREDVTRRGEDFSGLAAGQSPLALFISCSDSRVIPSLFTGARPGELFELRTAGNIVPPYRLDRPAGEVATIEFAVEMLGVADIVVCGHSHCGAVGALLGAADLRAAPALRGWLAEVADGTPGIGRPAQAAEDGASPAAPPRGDHAAAAQRHVLAQLDRLRRYPSIRRRVADGRITLHAWYYEVHTGSVLMHRPSTDAFLPL